MPTPRALTCPICSAAARLRYGDHPGYIRGRCYSIYACAECGVAFIAPRVEERDVYEHIYRQTAKVPGYRRYWKYARDVKQSPAPLTLLANLEDMYWGVVQALVADRPSGGTRRILEVGSGLGYLTYALVLAGYDAHGIDISSSAVNAAVAAYGPYYSCATLQEFAARGSDKYDTIIASELLEHLVDPTAFLASALSVLTANGHLILTTPNRTVYPAGVLWETDLPPVHYWWFSEQSIRELASSLGSTVRFVDFTAYQRQSPLFLSRRIPSSTPTRAPILNSDGSVATQPLTSRIRTTASALAPKLVRSHVVQRLQGRYRLLGARRTTLCAILTRPA